MSKFYQVMMDTMHSKTMTVCVNNNSTINFAPTANGLWVHQVDNPRSVQDMWSMLSTVSDKRKLYTKQAYKHAVLVRKLQNTIMQPSTCRYQDNIIDYMTVCPVTKPDIQATENIFGPNIGSLKGKTV
jgi:hypothetical protein